MGCGSATFNASREAAFASAVDASLEDDHDVAALAAHAYIRGSSPDDTRYDRALSILAQALESLELTYPASLYYLDIAAGRRDVDVLDKAFAGLERIVMGPAPHDRPTLVDGYLATADIDGLAPARRPFVSYVQALNSMRRGLDAWADSQLASLPAGGEYAYRGDYARAVRMLAHGEWEAASQAFTALIDDDAAPEAVRLDSQQALARLAMEQHRYDDAVTHYEAVKSRAKDHPELLLEMAWAHFHRGDSRRALGLLVALDAPVYGGLIAPERYLLEARLLRRLCQFEPARLAAVRLRVRHGDALADLHAGVRPSAGAALRAAARRRGRAHDAVAFRRQLEKEMRRVGDLRGKLGDALADELEKLYAIGLRRARRTEEAAVDEEAERLALELADAEDGVRLILHELGIGLLRGRQRPPGPDEIESLIVEAGGDNVSYRFAGEFWSDELDDLLVVMPNRCLD